MLELRDIKIETNGSDFALNDGDLLIDKCKIDEDYLASKLNMAEAQELAVALLEHHGAKAFADVADSVIDEYAEPAE